MTTTKTVLAIVEETLRREGYDGLAQRDGMCSCFVGDLAPCGMIEGHCEAGYRIPCPGPADCLIDGEGCDFHITTTKPEG
jgi:hypothetical protein